MTQTSFTGDDTYSFSNGPGDTYTSGHIHFVNITDLDYGTRYYYKCGDGRNHMGVEFSFKTPLAPGPDNGIYFGVVGDLG